MITAQVAAVHSSPLWPLSVPVGSKSTSFITWIIISFSLLPGISFVLSLSYSPIMHDAHSSTLHNVWNQQCSCISSSQNLPILCLFLLFTWANSTICHLNCLSVAHSALQNAEIYKLCYHVSLDGCKGMFRMAQHPWCTMHYSASTQKITRSKLLYRWKNNCGVINSLSAETSWHPGVCFAHMMICQLPYWDNYSPMMETRCDCSRRSKKKKNLWVCARWRKMLSITLRRANFRHHSRCSGCRNNCTLAGFQKCTWHYWDVEWWKTQGVQVVPMLV